jgi:cytidylate kinase
MAAIEKSEKPTGAPVFNIAIDGPGGVGKSTTARLVAQALGIAYIDTGAMYRAVALFCMENDIPMQDEAAVSAAMPDIRLENIDGVQHIYMNNRDVTDCIRTQEVSEGSSVVAAHRPVREKLVAQQQAMAAHTCVVMDGRDIASQVLPGAQVKIYLDASLETRTRRRMLDLSARGIPADFETVRRETIIRDERDKTRKAGPLVRVSDAVLIDTGMMRPGEVAAKIVEIQKGCK